ncbi:MAG: hypothetical protein ABWX85_15005, partial [Arthrobacter sp.]
EEAVDGPQAVMFRVRSGEDGAAELDDAGHGSKPKSHDDPTAKIVQPSCASWVRRAASAGLMRGTALG